MPSRDSVTRWVATPLRSVERQGQLELRAALGAEARGDAATVPLHHRLDDVEPEPGAGDPAVALDGGAVVLLEQPFGLLRRKPRPAVHDSEVQRVVVAHGADADDAAGR